VSTAGFAIRVRDQWVRYSTLERVVLKLQPLVRVVTSGGLLDKVLPPPRSRPFTENPRCEVSPSNNVLA